MTVDRHRSAVSSWLFFMAFLVFCMILLGGLTRLTHSGLSMVDWRPIMGVVPPLSEADWTNVFDKYKQFPEYKELNKGMNLPEFKKIFWFEYSHRILGRIIGLAFAVPFIYFLFRRAISPKLIPGLILLFCLGGLQGLIGWWMVKSGLVDVPDVSHYRLTVHLGLAFLLYVGLLWVSLRHRRPISRVPSPEMAIRARYISFICVWIFFTVLSGGLVAGLNAGSQYNTFPLMAGQLIPDGLFQRTPWYSNFTENLMTVQFDHRYMAKLSLIFVLTFWWFSRKLDLPKSCRLSLRCLLAAILLQFSLGVATLLSIAWLPLASMHQGGATILLTAAVWTAHEFRHLRPASDSTG